VSGGAIAFTPWFLESLKDSDAVEQAEIAVVRINGLVLMIFRKDDQMWPSATLLEIAMRLPTRHALRNTVLCRPSLVSRTGEREHAVIHAIDDKHIAGGVYRETGCLT
jgi:hypothetical protein